MSKYIPFILFTVLTNAAAQIMLKHGMMQAVPALAAQTNLVLKLFAIVFSPFVFLGLVTFVVSMASHLFVLSKVELSYAYPFLSLAYVVVAVATYFLFDEELNAARMAGIALICVGTVFIAQSAGKTDNSDAGAEPAATVGTKTSEGVR